MEKGMVLVVGEKFFDPVVKIFSPFNWLVDLVSSELRFCVTNPRRPKDYQWSTVRSCDSAKLGQAARDFSTLARDCSVFVRPQRLQQERSSGANHLIVIFFLAPKAAFWLEMNSEWSRKAGDLWKIFVYWIKCAKIERNPLTNVVTMMWSMKRLDLDQKH